MMMMMMFMMPLGGARRRSLRWGWRRWGWSRVRRENAGLSDKAEDGS